MHILLTAGPTREYLDDVRYLSNASSGRMGYAIAAAALAAGHTVTLVSGPVDLAPPAGCEVLRVETTRAMYEACLGVFPRCDGLIAAAAVCDYRPQSRRVGKLAKTGGPIQIEFVETEDILAELGGRKGHRWVIGFALEASGGAERALYKLRTKHCDAIVLNTPEAIAAEASTIQVYDAQEVLVGTWTGAKAETGRQLVDWITARFGGRDLRGG